MRKLAAAFRFFALFSPLTVAIANLTPTGNQGGMTYLPNGSDDAQPAQPVRQAQGKPVRQALGGPIHTRVYVEAQTNSADSNDSYDVFYDQLSKDGQWLYAENYGYVFQPSVAASNADWRPYSNGHWEWTDRGWYWDTEEPFGWATYHYGRWTNLEGAGWVWAPGTEWSPAWVSWRIADNGFIGWAPLPPECPRPSEAIAIGAWCDSYADIGPGAFSFLPFSAWFNPSYAGSFAPLSQNLELINASRNVTNISISKTVINDFGPRVEVVAQQAGRQINPYVLHYSAVTGKNNFERTITGATLNINGPAAKLRANATKVPTVVKTLVRPTVNKGWNGITKEEMDGIHNKYAAEAHIPRNLPAKSAESVSLVTGEHPGGIKLVRDPKEKEVKDKPENTKGAGGKGAKGKGEPASEHKGSGKTGKNKKGTKEEGGAKSAGSSKGTVGSKGEHSSKGKHHAKGDNESESDTGSKRDKESESAGTKASSHKGSAKEKSKKERSKDEESKGSDSKGSSGTKKKKPADD